ncbi:MAG: 2-oxoacid:acceptor oxidoreductase subunit alpha [Francisellaceae bacterium]|nr:2-oxoacid:acceptor oxidoreductase subunit alpha [Francisellaceae bacterium]
MSQQTWRVVAVNDVVIRFAGDSGDGIQSIGGQMGNASSLSGNEIRSYSDFPAEIKAPAGTTAGVSGYQLSISSKTIFAVGDVIDVLVALNPAALKVSISDLKPNGLLIIDSDKFTNKDFVKAGYESDPTVELDSSYTLISIPMTKLTVEGVKEFKISHSSAKRCKNMFALGVILAIHDKPMTSITGWILSKFKDDAIVSANIAALKKGYNYAEVSEILPIKYSVPIANLSPGSYTQITGNKALMLATLAISDAFENKVVVAGYPITPASEVLQLLIPYANRDFVACQMEDEIAAVSTALGASYAGGLGITITSGPGLDLMQEVIGLAIAAELPLVIVDVQRSGPSTGMPTKTEQTDLLAAIYGRHGESEIPVLAPRTPGECYDVMLEAAQIAINCMTPVIVLSEAVLANGSSPLNLDKLPKFDLKIPRLNGARNSTTYAPDWLYPGRVNSYRTIGGLEKDYDSNYISYDCHNHELMTQTRQNKLQSVTKLYENCNYESKAKVAIISWGATYGQVQSACEHLELYKLIFEHISLKNVHPISNEIIQHLSTKDKIIVVEQNNGQLFTLLSSKLSMKNMVKINSVTGEPFKINSLFLRLKSVLNEVDNAVLEEC